MDYIQNTADDVREMLRVIGAGSIDELFRDVPERIRLKRPLDLPAPLSELEACAHVGRLGDRNRPLPASRTFLGGGMYNHYVPAVVEHLPSRGEYLTAYTPYQAEASQGTLQEIFEYQTMICDLTGLDVSNASHYDGATACAEAIGIALNGSDSDRVVLSAALQPPYRQVSETYFRHVGASFVAAKCAGGATDLEDLRRASKGAACIAVQSPNAFGCIEDLEAIAAIAKENGCVSIAVVNPIALGLLKPPGACGCDIAVGDGQPLGGDPSFGGPSFGFLAARKDFLRRVPGRIVGQTTDREGKRAFVLTLQAREQHIRREKASSNICTNQALMALRATIFLAGLGMRGLPKLADLCLQKAHYLERKITAIPGVKRPHSAPFFHEFVVTLPKPPSAVNAELLKAGFVGGAPIGSWAPDLKNPWLLCATETCTKEDMDAFAEATAGILK